MEASSSEADRRLAEAGERIRPPARDNPVMRLLPAAGTPVRIVVDHRERGGDVAAALAARSDTTVTWAQLQAGDYRVEDAMVVERKTHADLAASLADGRLLAQAARLKRGPLRPLLVVVGDAPVPPAVLRRVQSISVMWYLPVLWARDGAECAEMLVSWARTWLRDTREHWLRPRRRRPTDDPQRLGFLCGLPGIGPVLARRLLDRFGSPGAACAASPEELALVAGIGPRRAERIREFLDRGQGEAMIREASPAYGAVSAWRGGSGREAGGHASHGAIFREAVGS